MRAIISLVIINLVFFYCNGCGNDSDRKTKPDSDSLGGQNNPTAESVTSKYIVEQKKGNKGVVIFIHGIGGNAQETWTNKANGAYFPNLVSQDDTFKHFDVFVYNYPSSIYREDYNINELSNDMLETFKDKDITKYDSIIIIAHSMGGLISRQFLLKYREIFQSKIKMIYFYATPTNGAGIANFANMFSNSKNIGIMREANGKDYLSDQSRDWRAVKYFRNIKTFCAYEILPTYSKLIVPYASASALCEEEPVGIKENHFDIVKPINKESKSFIVFRNAFKSVFPVSLIDSSPTPIRIIHSFSTYPVISSVSKYIGSGKIAADGLFLLHDNRNSSLQLLSLQQYQPA